jgi:alpha-beta hydrolase superfamily lysophospholipase
MDTLTAPDGTRLHTWHWAATGPVRGTVQLVHGLGEHMNRYPHVIAALNAAGWHVAAHDHRGHGASAGPRGDIPHADALLEDLARVSDLVRRALPGPHVLLGHSLGGLVAARFVAEALAPQPADWSRRFDGLVMSSPALDPGMNAVQKLLLAVLGPLAPHLALGNGLNPEWISRDRNVVEAYRRDRLVHDRVTPQMVRFIVDAGHAVAAAAPHWRVPTLLMWGGADRCVAPAGSARFAEAAPAEVLTARHYDKLAHEIFNEPEKAGVIARMTGWLERFPEHAAPQPPVATAR